MKRRTLMLAAVVVLLAALLPLQAVLAAGGLQTNGNVYTVEAGDYLALISRKFGVSPNVLLDLNGLRERADLLYVGEQMRLPYEVGTGQSNVLAYYYYATTGDTIQTVVNITEIDMLAFIRANGFDESATGATPLTGGVPYLVPAGPHYAVVGGSDTLSSIAARYDTTAEALAAVNPQAASGFVFVGQRIYVPIKYDAYGTAQITGSTTSDDFPIGVPITSQGIQTNGTAYVVQEGDLLYLISNKFGVGAGVILDLNGLRTRPDLLFAGETIQLPIEVGFEPSYVSPFYYVARPGDTVQTVLLLTEVDYSAFMLANYLPLDTPRYTPLTAGNSYLIPAGPHRAIVQPGDTLEDIAARYATTPSVLQAENPTLQAGGLYAGQGINVPIQYNVSSFVPATTGPLAQVTSPGEGIGGGGGGTAEGAPAVSGSVVGAGEPLQIQEIPVYRVADDPNEDLQNEVIATFAVVFRGGTGPYTLSIDGEPLALRGPFQQGEWSNVEFDLPAVCGGYRLHQVTFTATGSGESYDEYRFIGPVPCQND